MNFPPDVTKLANINFTGTRGGLSSKNLPREKHHDHVAALQINYKQKIKLITLLYL